MNAKKGIFAKRNGPGLKILNVVMKIVFLGWIVTIIALAAIHARFPQYVASAILFIGLGAGWFLAIYKLNAKDDNSLQEMLDDDIIIKPTEKLHK
jgi:hypothetical protein